MRSPEEINSRMMLNRIEELVLNTVYERMSRANSAMKEAGAENDFERGFNEGFDNAVESLWEIIQEHLDFIDYRLAK
jgi:hypothetical protein